MLSRKLPRQSCSWKAVLPIVPLSRDSRRTCWIGNTLSYRTTSRHYFTGVRAMNERLTLYRAARTCSRVTMTALEEIGVSYDVVMVNLMAGEQRTRPIARSIRCARCQPSRSAIACSPKMSRSCTISADNSRMPGSSTDGRSSGASADDCRSAVVFGDDPPACTVAPLSRNDDGRTPGRRPAKGSEMILYYRCSHD